MHLPDGFLNNQMAVSLIAVAGVFLTSAFFKLKQSWFVRVAVVKNKLALADGASDGAGVSWRWTLTLKGHQRWRLMGVIGALIFAAQMINFPVAQGTSGHFLGGVLAAVVLGPWAGLMVIGLVLIVQSLMFADGGVLALGANIVNMGLVAAVGGYYLYRAGVKFIKLGRFLMIGLTAWLTVVMASLFCALEIGWSGAISFALVIPAMFKIHLLIGLGEAALTVILIKALKLKLYEE